MTKRQLVWLGHATVRLDLGAARLLTDPVLRSRVGHLRRHGPPPPSPGAVDAVLLSHLHLDHADLPSLRRLEGRPVVYGPAGAARLIGSGHVVHEVAPGDRFSVAGVTVRVVHAEHRVRRLPWGPPSPALGFVADDVYFAGDTELFAGMADLGVIHAALLPVWGWGPTIGPGHLDPEGAARALALIAPRLAVPIHWGTFLPIGLHGRYGDLLRTPAGEFSAWAGRLAPDVDVRVARIGETIDLSA